MSLELWTPHDLHLLRTDPRMDPLPSYFLDTFFTETHYSDDKEIKIADLPQAYRRMAPFVLPSEQGKPIYTRKGEKISAFTPAYIKPKDVVRPEDARNVLPSEVFRNGGQLPSIAERFEKRVVDVTEFHLRSIRMTEIWMAARAFIDGKVTVSYERDQGAAYPEVLIDFGRDPNLTITLSTDLWDDPDHDIIGDLSAWSDLMYNAPQGGRPVQVLVGSQVAPYIPKNKGILSLLSTQIRGGESTRVERGLMNIDRPLSYIATLGGIGQGMEIATYKDTVEQANGSMVDILDPRDVVLVAPGARGVRAFGAIYDVKAIQGGSMPIDIFGKMFYTDDPGELYIMHQSAPLPIPLYPNRTLKARVL